MSDDRPTFKGKLAKLSPLERLWAQMDKRGPDECWPWIAALNKEGYGQMMLDGKIIKSHRAAYILLVGEIPDGLVIDHLCRNRSCANPAHMEPVTQGENTRRGESPSALASRRDVAQCGHPFSAWSPSRGRHCAACYRERFNAWQRDYRKKNADRLRPRVNEQQRLRRAMGRNVDV